jgi:hypothetical protein
MPLTAVIVSPIPPPEAIADRLFALWRDELVAVAEQANVGQAAGAQVGNAQPPGGGEEVAMR